jgi:hypothetical protein
MTKKREISGESVKLKDACKNQEDYDKIGRVGSPGY